ncbi:MAG: hypothetical protein AAF479_18120 [Pseudomonadota bacterium]
MKLLKSLFALAFLGLFAACTPTGVDSPVQPPDAPVVIEDRSKLEALVDQVTDLAPVVADIVTALGFEPFDITYEQAEALQVECLKWANLRAEASAREKRVCALATEIVSRPPIDAKAELTD